MSETINKHVYPIIDVMMVRAEEDAKEEGDKISCKMGCNHCCHLLVEVSWDEAEELATWVKQQPPEKKQAFIERIKANAQAARKVFDTDPETHKFKEPIDDDAEISEDTFEDYFYKNKIPCPILENGICGAYAHRPSPCRLHVVTSPAEFCAQDSEDAEVEVSQVFEDVRDEISPVLAAVSEDPRWGQLGIMVEAVLKEYGEA